MKHYEKLVELGCFSRGELADLLGSDATAASMIQSYIRKGYIERVRHDLYAVISLESKQPIPSRYQIGTHLFPDACVSHHSAFEFYGYANQVFYETYVTTKSRLSNFTYDGIHYRRVFPRCEAYVIQTGGVRITSIERTVIDSINDFEKIGGLEETLRCILLIPTLDCERLLEVLACHGSGYLYQKCGFLLEQINSSFGISQQFFDECRTHISGSKKYLMKGGIQQNWQEKWNLYAPDSIQSLIDKGVTAYDTI